MIQEKSQITHYIPEWVLWKFRKPSLYELNIFTGKAEVRAPKKAASGRDLWPNDIEDRLSEHDNAAARIYREKICGKQQVLLTDVERRAFATWIAYFYVRSPKRRMHVEKFLNEENQNREGLVEDLYRDRAASIERIKADNVEIYADAVAELGQSRADEAILAHYADYIRTAPTIGSPSDIQHYCMQNANTADYAKILLRYEWVWLYNRHGFVISDDPVVSWHMASRRWDYGIAREGVEITMPLALNLCLCLKQRPAKYRTQLQQIRLMEARELNCRQRLSAIKHVYGNSLEILDFINNPIVGWP